MFSTYLRTTPKPWPLLLATLLTFTLVLPQPLLTPSQPLVILILFLTSLSTAEPLLSLFQPPSTPPLIPHRSLPVLGHVLGLVRHGAHYLSSVNAITAHPIYTLLTLTGRTVVVTEPGLAAQVQRASPNTSFYGMILEVTKRLVGFDDESMRIIRRGVDPREEGDGEEDGARGGGLMHEAGHWVAGELAPGRALEELSKRQMERFSVIMEDMVPALDVGKETNGGPKADEGGEHGIETPLMDFLKSAFTTANAHTFYGPLNPFALDPSLVSAFWAWERDMASVMASPLPWLTSRRAWLAREAVNAALHAYVVEEHWRSASPLVRQRVQINLRHGLTPKMAGRAELILLFGILGNAVPTTFWVLAHVYSEPGLLAAIREETHCAVRIDDTPSSPCTKKTKTIRLAALKTCPLLHSTYRETLRRIANLSSVRLVLHTHRITAPAVSGTKKTGGYYTLRRGDMIQIASGTIHASEAVWGADAGSFNARRFLSDSSSRNDNPRAKDADTSTGERPSFLSVPKNIPSAAYRAFGGGSVICPGRHFAQNEILGFVALCVHMLDIVDAETGRAFKLPARDDRRIPLSVMKPVVEPRVKVRRRLGEEGTYWRVEP